MYLVPNVPNVPYVPNVPNVPIVPNVPNVPIVPNVPNVGVWCGRMLSHPEAWRRWNVQHMGPIL